MSELPSGSERGLFSPHGRIGRGTYSKRFGFCVLALVALTMLTVYVPSIHAVFVGLLLVTMAFLIITSIKRIHDIGYTGWVALILCTAPFFGIFLCVMMGEPGDNIYGVAPLK